MRQRIRTGLLFLGTIILQVLFTIKQLFRKRKKIHKPFQKAGCILRRFPFKLPKRLEHNTKNSKEEEKNEPAPHDCFVWCVPYKFTTKAKSNFCVGQYLVLPTAISVLDGIARTSLHWLSKILHGWNPSYMNSGKLRSSMFFRHGTNE